ncbi:TPA_asm: Rha family transcriptional regulator, partial [Listeria monocytogenes]|nr:Rha family transcriptional regulator [Listeria monocytogenes]
MNNLAVLDKNNTLNSREVAEMVEKRHSDLLRDIETYIRYINQNAKLRSDDFFSESTYRAGTGK